MDLCDRKRRILTAVVDDYVRTAEPVGSETLARSHDFGVRPATIRTELAIMSEMGYLHQPHTSAGRIPSDRGYRYYVDELMPSPRLKPSETTRARRSYTYYESEVDDILHQTCRVLSGLTRQTSLATMPQMGTIRLKHVALSAVEEGKILIVTVLNTGHIDNIVLDSRMKITSSDLTEVNNLINENLRGVDLKGLIEKSKRELPDNLKSLKPLHDRIINILKYALISASNDEICVEGTSHILKQPEFTKADKAARIFDALEQSRTLYQILGSSILGREVTVIIGSENQIGEMSECSFVASSYAVGGRVCGRIGVFGPTRMDYQRAVAAVRFMASNLSDLLTALSIG